MVKKHTKTVTGYFYLFYLGSFSHTSHAGFSYTSGAGFMWVFCFCLLFVVVVVVFTYTMLACSCWEFILHILC